jgi:hypothetical protein
MQAPFNAITTNTIYLNNRFGRLRDIAIGPNKEIYLATNGASWANTDPNTHSIIKLTPPNTSTGIAQANSSIQFFTYPNPAQREITIEYPRVQPDAGFAIALLNPLGQTILQLESVQSRVNLELPETCSSGLYFVRITDLSTKATSTNRLVIR